jgi:hypothetical protein
MAYTTIDDPSAYFKVQLYTGDGNSSKAITFDDTDTNMQPDFVWIKRRDDADSHFIYDSVRFDGSNAYWLQANNTNAEGSDRPLTAFGSDGFTIGSNNSALNGNTNTYVSWNWKETSTAGFDIIGYSGTGSTATVSHNLGVVPSLIILKCRTNANPDWIVFGKTLGGTVGSEFLKLNNTGAKTTGLDTSWFNQTAPTSSVFTVGTQGDVNGSSNTYIAYVFAEKKGFSKFGSYTGNASGNGAGPFIYTGFKSSFIMIKNASASSTDWLIFDNKRGGPVASYYGNNNKFF